MNVQWGQTVAHLSWHIVRRFSSISLCGRPLDTETIREDRPGNEKTCERCYQIGGPR